MKKVTLADAIESRALDRLRMVLAEKKMSQKALAQRARLHEATISRLMQGKAQLTGLLPAISEGLGILPQHLLAPPEAPAKGAVPLASHVVADVDGNFVLPGEVLAGLPHKEMIGAPPSLSGNPKLAIALGEPTRNGIKLKIGSVLFFGDGGEVAEGDTVLLSATHGSLVHGHIALVLDTRGSRARVMDVFTGSLYSLGEKDKNSALRLLWVALA